MPASQPENWARWTAWSLAAAVIAASFSIAVSGIFQACAVVCWLMDSRRRGRLIVQAPRFAWFLGALVVAMLISLIFSSDPVYSLRYVPKQFKFLLVPLIFTYFNRRYVLQTLSALTAMLVAAAVFGLVQFWWLLDVHLMNRIRGFMSHWMTFSGQMMMAVIVVCAWLLLRRPERRWAMAGWASLAVLTGALLLTYTRNAWVGTVAGVGVLLVFHSRRWLLPAGIVLVLLLALFPTQFRQRLLSSFDLGDETVQGRIELFQTGVRMIADHPLTGVGPMMVPRVKDQYRGPRDFGPGLYIHLHNSPLQIAAELGLPALLIWLTMWLYLLVDLFRRRTLFPRDSWEYWFQVCAFSLLFGFLVSGLLEFNYGDAELAIILLFIVTAPYVVTRDEAIAA